MPNNWKTYKLGELCNITSSKRIFYDEYVNAGIPFYRSKEIILKANLSEITNELFISEEKFNSIKQKFGVPLKDDILLTSVGTIGIPYQVRENDLFYFKDGNLTWIKDFKEHISSDYLIQWIKSNTGKDAINGITIGSTQSAITIQGLKNLEVILPPLQEQKAIASILSAIDDKIENNLAINKTLEEMAMALYKHWFVDFGPFQDGEFVESELGRIPKGWEVKTIYDVCDVVYGAAFKSKLFNENKEGFPLIRIRDLKTLKPQYYTLENHPKKTIIKAGDVVAGMDAEFDPYFWLGEDGVLNQRVVHFKPKTNFSRMFIYHSVLPWLKFYAGAKVGTTVIHLGKSDIDNFKIAVPVDFKSIKLFNEQAENYLEQIVNNSKENQTLTQLRDTLLPKLISGEVRLKEFRE